VTAKHTGSPFWKGLMKVKSDFFSRGLFKVGDGGSVRFWEDIWLGDVPLSQQYPSLYNIVHHRDVLVSTVLSQTPLNITFRRGLNDQKYDEWLHLCQRLININLTDEPDKFVWKLTDSGLFTVKSMYLDYMNGHTRFLRKYLWKLKIPLKINFYVVS
jgi:hypothetical protein